MSFDLDVWYAAAVMTLAEAETYSHHVNTDWVVVERLPKFDAFFAELLARFPDLCSPSAPPPSPDDVPNSLLFTFEELAAPPTPEQLAAVTSIAPAPSDSPWAASLTPLGTTLGLPIRWSRVAATAPGVLDLAAQYGLTVYDPQEGTVTTPPGATGGAIPDMLTVHLTLRISGKPPALDVLLEMDGQPMTHLTLASRVDAHAQAREAAISHNLAFYEIVDPASLRQWFHAQESRSEPMSPAEFRAQWGFDIPKLDVSH